MLFREYSCKNAGVAGFAEAFTSEERKERLNRKETGAVYEQAAAEYLEQQGCRILEKNFRSRYGEIDLVAEEAGTLGICGGKNTGRP